MNNLDPKFQKIFGQIYPHLTKLKTSDMTDFYLTKMGAKFFNADVPRLVKALERIADALQKFDKPAGVEISPKELMEIKDLYGQYHKIINEQKNMPGWVSEYPVIGNLIKSAEKKIAEQK